ncbi:uncharacterized protein LOC119719240 isoform X2 [Patiria miniata]|nr:uncharacterized protein LOC119719240 isoform X2 [Patiria miniata]
MYYYGGERPRSRPRQSQKRNAGRHRRPAVNNRRVNVVYNPSIRRREDHRASMRSSSDPQRDQDGDPPEKEGGIYKSVVDFATDTTTAHGFPNMFKATSTIGRLIWAFIFFTALGVFIWQASVLVRRYFMFPVSVEVEIITKAELEFPAVTVCNTNKVRRSALKQSKYKEALVIDDGETLPYYGPCIVGDFECGSNNLCLKQFLRCDGINHCRDFSDEFGCSYEKCDSNEFQCANGSIFGICISSTLKCDRQRDCYDGDDETDCPCKPTEFQCHRGGCIPKFSRCDDKKDCVDNSDEENCAIDGECTGAFRCTSDGSCVPMFYVCDKEDDCLGGEDETPEACASVTAPTSTSSPCTTDQFECGDGTCILSNWVCDEDVDCVTTRADENPMMCGRGDQTYGTQRCGDQEWLCGNQWQCIHNTDRCDLWPDCYSEGQISDDEYNCTCTLASAEPSLSQKVKCLGAAGRDTSIGYPTVDMSKFQGMSCYNHLEANPTPQPVWDWDAYVCHGDVVCANAATDFPELCQVFQECYLAPNAQDYRGRVGHTSSSTLCQDWSNDTAVNAGFSPDVYPELLGPVCRNPGGIRSFAWCFREGATTADDWELCDIGPPSATCHPGVDLPVRLAGKVNPSEGRVEVQHQGVWGTVSDSDWTIEDATVVCRQLGFDGASGRSTFAASTGSIFMSQVKCTGHESFLVDCQYHVVMPSEGLSHNMDVSVTCSGMRQKRQAEEEEVVATGNCSHAEFQCHSGECIPAWQTCNNFPDCEDGSDEYVDLECEDPESKCPVHEKPCRGSKHCILRTFECDGFSDCLSGTDEQFCNDPNEPCPEDYFQCNNGKCIHVFRVCNTIVDCQGGEDETQNCSYKSSDDGLLNPFQTNAWKDPFRPFIPEDIQEEFFLSFREDFYTPRPFSRVGREDPADWQRFVTFSELPDYSDLSEVLKLTAEEISQYGHQFSDFILQCTYDGIDCTYGQFIHIQNEKYGNCFTFNYREESGEAVRNSSRTGEQSGLSLTLFVEQDEYLSLHGREVGVRVSITTPDVAPLPANEGINLSPGAVTSIGVRYNVISRKPHPFGTCQVNTTTVLEIVNGKIVQVETNNYNRKHCLRVCVLQKVLQICNCSDSMELDGERCKLLDATQDLCKQMVYYLHSHGFLNCSCGTQCIDRLYTTTVSQSAWPSDAFRPHLLRNIHYLNPKTSKIRSEEQIRKNLVRLKIFFEELNYQETREVEDYSGTSLFGDIGGTIGLYIGFSIITFIEFIELLLYLIRTSCCKWTKARNN